ncbi:hypothetical protein CALCODRAFT_493122 [Calocera cornea HHB12733]|uniref:CRAL/TRIO N-terminal domain-containing protein n=1 Tax=Calocera cornea HHB12733 TaxID=1353952 RepID=A0A165HX58_9BASI|nr:hypothetical protein CALCODRAFT_493122 [Calocera cornea HHB12733]
MLSVEAAKKMLIHTLRWREEFAPEKAAQDLFHQEVFVKAGQSFGRDMEGRRNAPKSWLHSG